LTFCARRVGMGVAMDWVDFTKLVHGFFFNGCGKGTASAVPIEIEKRALAPEETEIENTASRLRSQ
jgi:hypothetical protein